MIYKIELTVTAEQHLKEWSKSGQKKILKKIADLFEELSLHPHSGTGHVEQRHYGDKIVIQKRL